MGKIEIMQTIIKIIIAFILLYTSSGYTQSNHDFSDKLSKYLSIQNKRLHFNGVVLIANKDKTIYEKAIGLASHELKVPISLDSKFKIASISKSFTGTLIAIAIKEGKLRLDDKIITYFPTYNLNDNWNKITIRHLVSHTSGIPHWKGLKNYFTIKSKLPIFKMNLLFLAGEKVQYSSPAYYLLATILENIYATTYANLLARKITDKLELRNIGVYNDTSILSNMVNGYHLLTDDNLIIAPYRNTAALKGAGNMYATAKDLHTWNKSLIDETSWKSSLTELMFTKTTNKTMPHNNNAFYGMGWYIHNSLQKRPKSYQVAGGTYGYSSISVIYPEEKMSVIILSNVSFLPINEIWNDIEKIIFNKPFKQPQVLISKEVSNDLLKKLIGTYLAPNGMKLRVIEYKSELFVKLGKNPPLKIILEEGLQFKAKKMNIKFMFKKGIDKKINILTTEGRGEKHEFKKLKE